MMTDVLLDKLNMSVVYLKGKSLLCVSHLVARYRIPAPGVKFDNSTTNIMKQSCYDSAEGRFRLFTEAINFYCSLLTFHFQWRSHSTNVFPEKLDGTIF